MLISFIKLINPRFSSLGFFSYIYSIQTNKEYENINPFYLSRNSNYFYYMVINYFNASATMGIIINNCSG